MSNHRSVRMNLSWALILGLGSVNPILADDSPSQQATKIAQIAADQAQRDVKEKDHYKQETQAQIDDNKGEAFHGCNVQWVKHQDPFGVAGVDGDVGLQFRVKQMKINGEWRIADTWMIASYYSASGNSHEQDHSGVITADGRAITFGQGEGYHQDNPMGVSDGKAKVEVVDYPMNYADFALIATGKIVHGTMAGESFDIKETSQGVFRFVYTETRPVGYVPYATPTPVPTPVKAKKKKRSS